MIEHIEFYHTTHRKRGLLINIGPFGSRLPSMSNICKSPRNSVSVSQYLGNIEIQIVEK